MNLDRAERAIEDAEQSTEAAARREREKERLEKQVETENECYADYAKNRIFNTFPKAHRGGWSDYSVERREHYELQIKARAWVRAFLDAYKKGDTIQGLRLIGCIGCGKTRVLYAIAKSLILNKVPRVYISNVPDLFDEIRRCWDPKGPSEADLIERILEKDVIFLDDLGAECGGSGEVKDYILLRLYSILDSVNRNRKPTLIYTSNLDNSRILANYGERIASRIAESTRYLGDFPKIDMRKEKGETGK
jgi:DNA replication protein DnaC